MKNVLITGVSRGIGRALAQIFTKGEYNVLGTTVVGDPPFSSEKLAIFTLDLSSSASIETCVRNITSRVPNIDILVNNAGILIDEDDTHVMVDKLRKTLDVNVIGTIDFTERIIPILNKESHIVNITSMAGSLNDTDIASTTSHFPYHYPAYKISKCALNMYTRTLAMRMQNENRAGVIVSAVHPGWVKTDMGGDDAPTTPEEAAKHIYQLAISRPESGQFWFEGKKYAW